MRRDKVLSDGHACHSGRRGDRHTKLGIPASWFPRPYDVQGGEQAIALIHWEGKFQMSQVAFANLLEHGSVRERFPRWVRITHPLLRRPAAAVTLAFVAGVGGFVGGFVANRTFGH